MSGKSEKASSPNDRLRDSKEGIFWKLASSSKKVHVIAVRCRRRGHSQFKLSNLMLRSVYSLRKLEIRVDR